MKLLLFVSLIAISLQLQAQETVPVGTIVPVQLNSSLRSEKAKAGEQITARVMQDVPLASGRKIHSGAEVIGHVISAQPADNGKGGEISLRFDTLKIGKQNIAMITNLRALADMMDIFEAQVPQTGPDRGTSEDQWTTNQIGGETVYRGSVVTNGSNVVGKSLLSGGVLVHVSSTPGFKCRDGVDENDQQQALWVFSSDACGLYDLPNLTLAHAGRTAPVGQITLQARADNVKVRAGSGLLLRVNGTTHQ